jgi:O-antigen/teichoic acid export membrane protein
MESFVQAERTPHQGSTIVPTKSFLVRAGEIGASQIIRRAARFLFLVVAARKLGPSTFGVYAVLLASVETLSLISGEGLIDYIAREGARNPIILRQLVSQVTQLRLFYAVLILPVALLVLDLFSYSRSAMTGAFWMLLILFARAPLGASQGAFRATHRTAALIWLEVFQAAILLLATTIYLILGASLESVILAELVSNCAGAVVGIWMFKTIWQVGKNGFFKLRPLLKATFAFNLYPLITNIYDRVDLLLLFALAGSAAAGIYSLPYRSVAVLQIVPFGLMTALLPVIAPANSAMREKSVCSQISNLLFTLSLFPVLVIALLSNQIVAEFLGAQYRESAVALRILIWALVPMFVNFGLNTYLLARGCERLFIRTASICALVNIGANLLFIPRYSYLAAAIVTIATEVVLLVQHSVIIYRAFGFLPFHHEFLVTSLVFFALLFAALVGSSYLSNVAVVLLASLGLGFYSYKTRTVQSFIRSFTPQPTTG